MALSDWVSAGGNIRGGGQGYVEKVQHRVDGRIGALKRLHGESSRQTERRYRFLMEVGALRALDGNGVPRVFEASESLWKHKEVELFVVMEFIDGPTLAELVQKSPPTVEESIRTTVRIGQIIGASHKLPILHRDLKPDNIILRDSRWDDPVLVDLGLAWGEIGVVPDFETSLGRELGNRFLRLPEFAPGGDHRDARSDVTMAAGLLFFMLSGRAPRTLVDHAGRHPHEIEPCPIRGEILLDGRWQKLRNILQIAFQQRLEARFQSAVELSNRLSQIDARTREMPDSLDEEIARLLDLRGTVLLRERTQAAPTMESVSRELYSELSTIWKSVGLQQAGQNPVFKHGGATNEFYCVVSRSGETDPNVLFRHKIELSNGRLQASWSLVEGPSGQAFEGSAADHDGLRSAVLEGARGMAAVAIRQLADKLTR